MSRIQPSTHIWIRLIVLFILLTNVPACNMGQPPVNDATATPLPTEAPSSDVETNGPVVITFAGYEFERQLYEPLMAEFHQQNPNITVQFVALPEYTDQTKDMYADYPRLLASTADTGVTSGFGPGATAYFRDLTSLMEADPGFNPADFWTAVSDACQDADGHVLGVPMSIGLRGVYYNAKAFDEAGLQRPAPGWTWDDFRKDVAALAKTEGETIRYGYAERFGTILSPLIEAAIAGNGSEIVPAALQPVVQWYLDLVKAKAIRPAPDYDEPGQDDWNTLFQSENRPAMWRGNLGDTMPGSDFSTGMAYQGYGFVPYPVASDGSNSRTTPVGVQCLAVSSGSQNPRAAWEWLGFLSLNWLVLDKSSPGAIATVPGRISVAEADGFWKNLPAELEPTVRYILEQGGYGNTLYADAAWAVSKALAKAAAGHADFVTALEEAKAQLAAAPSGPGEPVVVAPPQPTLSTDTTAIDFLYQAWGKEESQALESLAEAYNKAHPDTRVNLATKFAFPENGDYLQVLTENFDCFISSPEDWKSGYFLPLNSFVESEESAFLQDFDPALLDRFRYEGVIYALPAFSQPTVMVYNADLLAKRGLKPPSNDWTFDDYIELATKAASTSETEKSYGMIFSVGDPQLFIGRGVELGDTSADPPIPPKFDSPEFASALAWIADLNQAGVLLIESQENYDEVIKIVQAGQLAFWQTQVGFLGGSYFPSDDKPKYKIGIVPMPTSDDPNGMRTWSLDRGFIISSKARNPQLCWDWIKFLSEQPYLSMGIPARKSVASSPAWEAVVGKQYADVYRLARARVRPPEPYDPSVGPFGIWRGQAVAAALNGDDYQKLLPVLQTKAEDYLACMSTVDQAKLSNDELNTAITKCTRQVDPEGNWGP